MQGIMWAVVVVVVDFRPATSSSFSKPKTQEQRRQFPPHAVLKSCEEERQTSDHQEFPPSETFQVRLGNPKGQRFFSDTRAFPFALFALCLMPFAFCDSKSAIPIPGLARLTSALAFFESRL